ncbi:putative nucleotidyltransferase, ribonuclease H, partial [Tanacetum coccineum]
ASARLAKKGPHSKDMWETFKQVKINLPLIDAIKQILAYAMFLKDLCTQKRKLKATLPKKIDLTKHVSAVLSSFLPPKFKDPEAPFDFICGADRSTKITRGILEDVIVKVDDFYYPVDFFVMDNEKLRLNVFNSLNSPISNDCYHIDTINECIQTYTPSMNLDRTLENLHCVDSENELFDRMTFREREEEFQMIKEEFLLSLEETPLQSQQVQQPTMNEVQEYFDCLLVHQDVLLRARGSSKDHFPLPFIDQIVEKLSGQKFYSFFDGYSGYNQIPIHPDDHAKTTFTCPYGTFAFRRMPFGLCNAPATFQQCMMSIFSDMVGESVCSPQIFMDDFSIFGQSFESCLGQLESVLKRCIKTNLVLSWEKSHFMVREGIVLGHVVSEKGFSC